MNAILRKSGLETRDKRKGVKGHALLYPEWHLALAGQYLDAYETLRTPRQPMQPYWPRYFLLGHSVDLVLKGYLGRKGVSEGSLKKLKHDIRPLLKRAADLGLILARKDRALIARLDDKSLNRPRKGYLKRSKTTQAVRGRLSLSTRAS